MTCKVVKRETPPKTPKMFSTRSALGVLRATPRCVATAARSTALLGDCGDETNYDSGCNRPLRPNGGCPRTARNGGSPLCF
eukprot:208618-Lingulodinium_polyedra.AAC.1